ncbi:rhomboid family intramembrane serine protease [Mesorhizobium sp. ArgA1]
MNPGSRENESLSIRPHVSASPLVCRLLQPVAATLALITAVVSVLVTYKVSGSWFGVVSVVSLREYGGTTFEDVGNFELWRLASAQLIHVKLLHMLLNVICLVLIASQVERRVGGITTLLIWLLAGGLATLLSTIGIEERWNVGSGASQANFAFAGCAIVFAFSSSTRRVLTASLIALVVVPGIALDLFHAGYPKPGHASGFLFGAAFGLVFRRLLVLD